MIRHARADRNHSRHRCAVFEWKAFRCRRGFQIPPWSSAFSFSDIVEQFKKRTEDRLAARLAEFEAETEELTARYKDAYRDALTRPMMGYCPYRPETVPDAVIDNWPRVRADIRHVGVVVRICKHWSYYSDQYAYRRGYQDAVNQSIRQANASASASGKTFLRGAQS